MSKNEQIKKAFAENEYTPEQIQELKRCMKDPVYFISNYIRVQHPTKGSTLFKLYEYQEELVKHLLQERWCVALLARQMGKTATISMFLLWYSMFHKDKTILIASKNNAHAIEIMDRIRFAYEELPNWLKAGVKYYNKHSIEFDNGSRIKSEATTEKTGRGLSISKLYLDELSFINPRIQRALWTSLAPTLSTGGSAIISSTPNGDTDLFAELWNGAKNHSGVNEFYAISFPWDRHPERGEEYAITMKKQLGDVMFSQEVLCEFISSDALLVSTKKLAALRSKNPAWESMGFKFWKDESEIGGKKYTYLVGVDPATGNNSDFTVIQVVEFPSLTQIAELRLSTVNLPLIYSKIKWILNFLQRLIPGKGKSEVLWSFERNGIGEALVALIQNDNDKNGGVWLDHVELYNDNPKKLGCYTTLKTKTVACIALKSLIESGQLSINSNALIFELKNYVSSGASYSAKSGCTDDAVAAMLIITRLLDRLAEYNEVAHEKMFSNVAPDSDENYDEDDGGAMPFMVL